MKVRRCAASVAVILAITSLTATAVQPAAASQTPVGSARTLGLPEIPRTGPVDASRDLLRLALPTSVPVQNDPVYKPSYVPPKPTVVAAVVEKPALKEIGKVPVKTSTPVSKPVIKVPVVTVARGAIQTYALQRLGSVQYSCLAGIIAGENRGWIPTLANYGGSGAYGIPQALPGRKMASAGADWRTNGITQIKWMIGYVDARYGSACDAYHYRLRHGSY